MEKHRLVVGVGYDERDGGMVYDTLGEAVHGSERWFAGSDRRETGPLRGVAVLLASLAAERDNKSTQQLSYYLKNGFPEVCFRCRGSGEISFPGVQAEMIFRRCRTFLALDTSAEWSNPLKRVPA